MISRHEQLLAEAWMKAFGEPVPILGCPDLVLRILKDYGAELPRLEDWLAAG